MRDLELGRIVRALRRRRGWRQEDAAVRARVHRSTWSLVERGHIDRLTFSTVRRCLAALEVRLDLQPCWRGSELDRLLDEGHAAVEAAWKQRLERWRWDVRVEVSFNRFGERGRIDLLAWYAALRILLVVEIKTEIVDGQSLLGGMDVKVRLGPTVAVALGWRSPAIVLPLLVVADTSTNRRRLARIQPLFTQFSRQGKEAISWLHRPDQAPGGLLVFSVLSAANVRRVKRVGTHRVRLHGGATSVESAGPSPARSPELG